MNWNSIVQDFIVKHNDQIHRTTRPLREHLDATYFTYHRIDLEGKYTVLVDRPDWAERYVEKQLYLNDPYLRHLDRYESGICTMFTNGTEEFREQVFREGKDVLDAQDTAFLIEKSPDFVEFFGFAGRSGSSRLSEVVLNRPAYLRAFAVYFKSKMQGVLQLMREGASPLVKLKGDDFYNTDPIHADPSSSLKSYLSEIGLHYLVDASGRLSGQERKCLLHLAEGKTAKEIATVLRLSPRTVESYLEHIKNKLSCSGPVLFDLARQLQMYGLLP